MTRAPGRKQAGCRLLGAPDDRGHGRSARECSVAAVTCRPSRDEGHQPPGVRPRSWLGPSQLLAEVEPGSEVAVDQVPVGLESERGRVVAHPALQAQRAQSGLDQHRRARVTKGVEADTGQAGALGGGDEHAAAQAALIRRTAVATRKDERVVDGIARPMSAQRGSKFGRQRDQPRAVARLGRDDRAFDERAPHLQMRRVVVEDEGLRRRPRCARRRPIPHTPAAKLDAPRKRLESRPWTFEVRSGTRLWRRPRALASSSSVESITDSSARKSCGKAPDHGRMSFSVAVKRSPDSSSWPSMCRRAGPASVHSSRK